MTFHAIRATSFTEAARKKGGDVIMHPPSNKSNKHLHLLGTLSMPWDNEEYLVVVREVEQLINSVDADAVVIDTLFTPAVDACRVAGRRYLLNSPTQTLDSVRFSQPKLRGFWYYPA